jgi:glycosyltransferase involved in cell wall biosynthesis
VLQDFDPHIVHTHSYVMRYTLPVARCRAVHTVHNLASREVEGPGRVVHRIGYRLGVVPVAVAEAVADSFEREYGFRPATIPNGIDVRRFHRPECRSAWRAANGFRDDDVLIVSVARLEPQKNPELLVRSLPEACHLLLAGEGSLRPRLEGRPRVSLLGVRSDLPELLSSCDVFALASDWEGHPIAVMEAMAAGLPVVSTAVGGVPEIVGDAGVLVPAGDENALRAGLESALRNRDGYTKAALERAAAFDVRRTISSYSALFEQIVR